MNDDDLFGTAWLIGWLVVRRYARNYLERTKGPLPAAAFIHRADRTLGLAVVLGVAIFLAALPVSYTSLALSDILMISSVTVVLAMVLPFTFRFFAYARAEKTYRRAVRGPLTSRLYQTAHAYLPDLFP